MTFRPKITVAPNGARLQKGDHPALPMTAQELAQTALSCARAGADAIHLHVRDEQGAHSLNCDLYRNAIEAVTQAAPDLDIQVTTESAGQFNVSDQLELLRDLKPKAASVSVREIARAPDLAAHAYATAAKHGTQVQHILYGESCLGQLQIWFDQQFIPATMSDAILVLGQYDPPQAGNPQDLAPLTRKAHDAGLTITVCAFGPHEQACLLTAAALGCHLRVGFENNMLAPDGSTWADNSESVAALREALSQGTPS